MPLIEEAPVTTVDRPRPDRPGMTRGREAALVGAAGGLCAAAWLVTSPTTSAASPIFWPRWLVLAVVVFGGANVGLRPVLRRTPQAGRGLARHAVNAGVGLVFLLLVGLFSANTLGLWQHETPFWPKWVAAALLVGLTVHAVVAGPVRRSRAERSRTERVLTTRVDELTRTRQGALDVQTVELRRIERDLHDGAQARLVALTLTLGRAERRLRDHPEAAALVREAHRDADLAIAELRELARGIAPPILTDRGLVEAVRALGRRSGIRVAVRADIPRRLPPSVELAGYFITAEALTNAVKHAGTPDHPATATVTLDLVGATLVVQVADDGPGGADPFGSGLAGLAQRAAALDGTFTVGDLGDPTAPGGSVGGTVVRAELPCGW